MLLFIIGDIDDIDNVCYAAVHKPHYTSCPSGTDSQLKNKQRKKPRLGQLADLFTYSQRVDQAPGSATCYVPETVKRATTDKPGLWSVAHARSRMSCGCEEGRLAESSR